MWAKTIQAIALAALAGAFWGCAMAQDFAARMGRPAPEAKNITGRASPEEKAELAALVTLISQEQHDDAAEKLMTLIPRLVTSGDRPVIAEATFWLGFCREKQERLDEAAQLYRKVAKDYNETPAARRAEERLENLGGKIV